MDVDYNTGPKYTLNDFGHDLIHKVYKLDDPWTYWDTIGQVGLVSVAGSWLARGSLTAFNFTLRQGIPQVAQLLVPFTVAARSPGVIQVIGDIGWYVGVPVAIAQLDLQRRITEWFSNLDEATLKNALGLDGWAKLTANGTVSDITALFYMPPAWYTDP